MTRFHGHPETAVRSRPRGADLEYLRLLRLAATTMECQVEDALARTLEAGLRPDYERIEAAVAPRQPSCPEMEQKLPDLNAYDALLADAEVLS